MGKKLLISITFINISIILIARYYQITNIRAKVIYDDNVNSMLAQLITKFSCVSFTSEYLDTWGQLGE